MALDDVGSRAKVVHVITGLGRGGAENSLYRLISKSPDPSTMKVISLTDGGIFQSQLERLGVEVRCLRLSSAFDAPRKIVELILLLRRWRPRLVQTWMYHADLVGGVAARCVGIPVCWGIRNSDLSPTHNKLVTRLVARLCALLSPIIPSAAISCSSRAAEIHKGLGYSVPIEVVPNGLPLELWSPNRVERAGMREALGLRREEFVLAHVGRNHPQKDHVNLARAFTLAYAERPFLRLILCGQGLTPGESYFDALPFGQAAREAVVALGPRDDLPGILQAADGFVLSSSGEAFPNVVVEAMACELPCVVTDVGDSAEIVGDAGLVVPSCDSSQLASALVSLVDMPRHARSRLGERARQRVLVNFSMNRMVDSYQRIWCAVEEKG